MSRSVLAVLAIALGLPFLILLALVSSASGVSTSVFTHALGLVIMSVFLMLVVLRSSGSRICRRMRIEIRHRFQASLRIERRNAILKSSNSDRRGGLSCGP
jgi:hypothetical protein